MYNFECIVCKSIPAYIFNTGIICLHCYDILNFDIDDIINISVTHIKGLELLAMRAVVASILKNNNFKIVVSWGRINIILDSIIQLYPTNELFDYNTLIKKKYYN